MLTIGVKFHSGESRHRPQQMHTISEHYGSFRQMPFFAASAPT
jgi:hypothetical protein